MSSLERVRGRRKERHWLCFPGALFLLSFTRIILFGGATSQFLHRSNGIGVHVDKVRQPSFPEEEYSSITTARRRQLSQTVAEVATPAELLGALRNAEISVIRVTSTFLNLNTSEWINIAQPVVLSRPVLLLGGSRYNYNGSVVGVNPAGLYVTLDCSSLVDRLQLAGTDAASADLGTEVGGSLQLQGLWIRNHLPPTGHRPLILTSPSGSGSIRYIDCVLERYVGMQINITAEEVSMVSPAEGQPQQDVRMAAGTWCPPPLPTAWTAAPASSSPAAASLQSSLCLGTALSYLQFSTVVWFRCSTQDGGDVCRSSSNSNSSGSESESKALNDSLRSARAPTAWRLLGTSDATPAANNPGAPLLVVLSNCTYIVQHEVSTVCVRTFGADACIYQLQAQLLFSPSGLQPDALGPASRDGGNGGLGSAASAGVSVVATLVGCLVLVLLVHFVRRIRGGHRTLTLAVRPPGATHLTTLLVTDIQNSTNLWEQLPTSVMNEALRLHHRCLRGLLPKCNGYESATEGDSFILAFHGPLDAARFAILAQAALLELPWPQELLEHEDGREVWAEAARPKVLGPPSRVGIGGCNTQSRSQTMGGMVLAQASSSGPNHGLGNQAQDDISDDENVNTSVAAPSGLATMTSAERSITGVQAALFHSLLSAQPTGLLSKSISRKTNVLKMSGAQQRSFGPFLVDDHPASSSNKGTATVPDGVSLRYHSRADVSGSQELHSALTQEHLWQSKHPASLSAGNAAYITASSELPGSQLSGTDIPNVAAGDIISACAGKEHMRSFTGASSARKMLRGRSWDNIRCAITEGLNSGRARVGVQRADSFGPAAAVAPNLSLPPEVIAKKIAAMGASVDSSRGTPEANGALSRSRSVTGAPSDGLMGSILESLTLRFVYRTNSTRNLSAHAPTAAEAIVIGQKPAAAAATTTRAAESGSVIFPGWGGCGKDAEDMGAGGTTNSITFPFSDKSKRGGKNLTWATNPLALLPLSNGGNPDTDSANADPTVTAVNVASLPSLFTGGSNLEPDAWSPRLAAGPASSGNTPDRPRSNKSSRAIERACPPGSEVLLAAQGSEAADSTRPAAGLRASRPSFGSPGPLGEGLEEHADVAWVPTSHDDDDLPCGIILVSHEDGQLQMPPPRVSIPPINARPMLRKGSFGSATPLVPSRLGLRQSTPTSMTQTQFADMLHAPAFPIGAAVGQVAVASGNEIGGRMDAPGDGGVGSCNASPSAAGGELQLQHLLPASIVLNNRSVTSELLALLTGSGGAATKTDAGGPTAAAAGGQGGPQASDRESSVGALGRDGARHGDAAAALVDGGLHPLHREATQELFLPLGVSEASCLSGEAPVVRAAGGVRTHVTSSGYSRSARHPHMVGQGEEVEPRMDAGDHRSRAHTFHGFQQQPQQHLLRFEASNTSHSLLIGSAPLQPQGKSASNRTGFNRSRTQALEMIPLPEKLPEIRQTWRQLCASNWPLLSSAPRLMLAGFAPRKRSSSLDLPSTLNNSSGMLLQPHPEAPDGDGEQDDAAPHQHQHNHLLQLPLQHNHQRAIKTPKGAVLLFRGCRVRMGLHTGIPLTTDVTFNHTTGHMAYSGMPLKVAKAVGDSAAGGSVLLSNTTFNLLHPHLPELPSHPEAHYCGDAQIELVIRSLYMLVARDQHPRLGYLAPLRNLRFLQTGNLDAPVGTVAICFMTVSGATKAVAELGQPAVSALQQFKSIVTRECCDCGGFVVEATDGLCLAAFMEPAAATIWALRCQEALGAHNWSPEVLASPHFREVREYQKIQRGRGQPSRRVASVVSRGPRIRTGIDIGSVTAEVSSTTARLSYRGKVMNRSARVAAQATDSQVLLSEAAWQRVVATAGICALVADGVFRSPRGTDCQQSFPVKSPSLGPGQGLPTSYNAPATNKGQEVSLRSGIGAPSPVRAASFVSNISPSGCPSPLPTGPPLPSGPSATASVSCPSPVGSEGVNQLLAAANQLLLDTASDGDSEDVDQLVSAATAVGMTLPALPQGRCLSGNSAGRFTLKGVSEPQELFHVRMEALTKPNVSPSSQIASAAGAKEKEQGSRSANAGAQSAPRAAAPAATAATGILIPSFRSPSFGQRPQSEPFTAEAARPQVPSESPIGQSASFSGVVKTAGQPFCSPTSNLAERLRTEDEGDKPRMKSFEAASSPHQLMQQQPSCSARKIAESSLRVKGPSPAMLLIPSEVSAAEDRWTAVGNEEPSLILLAESQTDPQTACDHSREYQYTVANVMPSSASGQQQIQQEQRQKQQPGAESTRAQVIISVGTEESSAATKENALAGDALLEMLANAILQEDSS